MEELQKIVDEFKKFEEEREIEERFVRKNTLNGTQRYISDTISQITVS